MRPRHRRLYLFSVSPLFNGFICLFDKYLMYTGIVHFLSGLGQTISFFGSGWISGWIFTYHDPNIFLYVVFVSSVSCGVMVVLVCIFGSRHGNRFHLEQLFMEKCLYDTRDDGVITSTYM